MIRINLLESITDKPTSAAVLVEKKVSNPASRFYLLSAVIGGLLIVTAAFHYLWATSSKARADEQLAEQQKIAKELESVMKEQAELDRKIKDTDMRINAIKELRADQAGPGAVLQALSERIVSAPGLYLESVQQKGKELTISGYSPNETTVTNFGRSLEFSSGLFSNLSISTQLDELKVTPLAPNGGAVAQNMGELEAPKLAGVTFTIKCDYTPSKAAEKSTLPNGQPANAPTTQPATATAANRGESAEQTEIAKN